MPSVAEALCDDTEQYLDGGQVERPEPVDPEDNPHADKLRAENPLPLPGGGVLDRPIEQDEAHTAIQGSPTTGKILDKGWTPISYRTESGIRYGWMIVDAGGSSLVRFPGDREAFWVQGAMRRHIGLLPHTGAQAP